MSKYAMTMLLGLAIITTASSKEITSCAQESEDISVYEMTMEELIDYYNLDELAECYGIDVELLADKYYEGIHSDSFHLFSDLVAEVESFDYTDELIKTGARTQIAYDQDSTMYLATGNTCASGNYPYLGCVAVHKKSSTDSSPVLAFGTKIYYEDNSVNINGANYESFIVEDTGTGNGRTAYWTDVYGGANTEANQEMAKNYGVQKVDISW